MKVVFLIAACASVLAVFLICVFLLQMASCNGKDWSLKIPLRNGMETDKR